jgi:large subunit ribosomal protein L4
VLLVVPERDEVVDRTTRNIPTVTVLPVDGLNVYDVLRHKNIVVTQDAARKIESRLGG